MSRHVNLEKTMKEIRALTVAEGEHKAKLRARLLSDFRAQEKPMSTKMRFALAACTIGLVVLAYTFFAPSRTPKALAATMEALKKATSMVCTGVIEMDHGGEPEAVNMTIYWSDGMTRADFGGEGQPVHKTMWVEPGKKTTIDYADPAKPLATIVLGSADSMNDMGQIASAEAFIEMLRRSGSVKVAGERVEDGQELSVLHFEQWNGLRQDVEIAVDVATDLPVSVTHTFDGGRARQDYHWNVEIEPQLMRVRLPDGVKARVIDASEAPESKRARRSGPAVLHNCKSRHAGNKRSFVLPLKQEEGGVHSKGYAEQNDPQSKPQDELTLARLQGDGGGDRPGEASDVSPEHHGHPHFADHPAEPRHHGRDDSVPALTEHHPELLKHSGAQGLACEKEPAVHPLHSGYGEVDHDGTRQNELPEHDARRGE